MAVAAGKVGSIADEDLRKLKDNARSCQELERQRVQKDKEKEIEDWASKAVAGSMAKAHSCVKGVPLMLQGGDVYPRYSTADDVFPQPITPYH